LKRVNDLKLYRVVTDFFHRYFSDEEAVILFFLFLIFFFLLYWFGKILTPMFAAVIIAYLLSPLIDKIERFKIPHSIAVTLVFLCFFGLVTVSLLILIPSLVRQVSSLVADVPRMMGLLQTEIASLPMRFPDLFSDEVVGQWVTSFDLKKVGQQLSLWLPDVLSFSLYTIPSLISFLVYAIVVPLMVFFLLKDREQLWGSFKNILPERRRLMNQIASEMNIQIANYIRGKAVEILIVGGVSYITLQILGLEYAALLAVLIGLSVLVPYIGAIFVTIPVFAAGVLQWGFTPDLYSVLIAYLIIQMLDGNVLVPLLFSEAVNLHPVAIIVAVIIFGGVWGFWGVFFAIPLATLVKAIFNAWPKHQELENTGA
jgi:putative permease